MFKLLRRDSSLNLSHVKWFRSINQIQMKEQPYLLEKTEYKRNFIYGYIPQLKLEIVKDTIAYDAFDNKII